LFLVFFFVLSLLDLILIWCYNFNSGFEKYELVAE